MTAIETDVLVVGAGPIGIEMAVALKQAGIPYVHLDAGQIGSTIAWYAPQTPFFSSPERIAISGVPLHTVDQTKATREEYLAYLRGVVQQFDLQIHTYERVVGIRRKDDGTFSVTSRGNGRRRRWHAKNIVLAVGDMHRPRVLEVPGETLPHVSHYFGDPHTYFRRRVLIVGGRNSAIEAAVRCVRVGAHVTLSYRRPQLDPSHVKFWLLPEIEGMIRDQRLTFLPSTAVREIHNDAVILDRLTDEAEGSLSVPVDFVLLLTGYEQDPELFIQAGVELWGPARQPVVEEKTMETNIPGIYVAGTAVAGTQAGQGTRHFIENSHIHVERILAALTGKKAPTKEKTWDMLES